MKLEDAIVATRCSRVTTPHPECTAAAVREWVAAILEDQESAWQHGLNTDPDDDRYYAGAVQAVQDLRSKLVGNPYDADLEPAGAL